MAGTSDKIYKSYFGHHSDKGKGPSLYYVSKMTAWVQKIAIFADVQYCIYADIVGGSEKVKKHADINNIGMPRDHPYIMSEYFWTFFDPPAMSA